MPGQAHTAQQLAAQFGNPARLRQILNGHITVNPAELAEAMMIDVHDLVAWANSDVRPDEPEQLIRSAYT